MSHVPSKMASKSNSPTGETAQYTLGEPIPRSFITKSNQLDPSSPAQVYRLDGKTIAKTGDGVNMSEAASLRYVRERTSVPVPEVLESYVHPETGYACIIMEYVEGTTLDEAWPSYSDEEKDGVTRQLKGYLDELRAIEGETIGTLDGGVVEDQFFYGKPESAGPFGSVDAFHEGLIEVLEARDSGPWTAKVAGFIRNLRREQYKVVFTHNDIAPRNVIVRGDKVCAIVDWELAGFFPEYWEYVSAVCWADWAPPPSDKKGSFESVLDPYLEELAIVRHVLKLLFW